MINEIDYLNRVVFGNLFIKTGVNYTLLNLYSFRRMLIDKKNLQLLLSARDKKGSGQTLSLEEQALLYKLQKYKQILSNEVLDNYKSEKAKQHFESLDKIQYKINNITISPTFACNFKCAYCYQKEFKNKNVFLSRKGVDNICKIIKEINGASHHLDGVDAVHINGGEPLQERNIDTINYIIKKFKGENNKLSLLTNGYNIMKFKDQIDFSCFTSIQVSLDGVEEIAKVINQFNKPIFDEVVKGIQYLLNIGVNVKIATILTNELANNLQGFFDELDKAGLCNNDKVDMDISACVKFGEGTLDTDFMSFDTYLQIKKLIRSIKKPHNVTIGNLAETRWITKALYRDINERLETSPAMCSILKNRSMIFAPNGKIYWCLCVNPEHGIIGTFYPEINYSKDTIDGYLNRNIYTMEKCRSCDFQYICSGGCPLNAVAANGNYDSPYCGLFNNTYFWEHLEEFL